MATDKDKFEVMQGVIDLREKQIKRLNAKLERLEIQHATDKMLIRKREKELNALHRKLMKM